MDLTQGTPEEKNKRAKKMMLWFGIISLTMSFAGWTSAFIVSSSRPDWMSDFSLPSAFTVSTVLIILSSLTLFGAKFTLKKGNRNVTALLLLATFVLGVAFIMNQLRGFQQIIDLGYNFTGSTSNVTMSYIYIVAVVHIVHVVAGLICLLVVIINYLRGKYSPENKLGFDLASTFWHFVDVLWLFLFLFLTFVK